MEIKRPIQIIYAPGTFGNCVRWMFDRFTKGSKFKDMYSPWDEHGRVHGFNDDDYNTEKFVRGHQVKGRADSPIPNTDKVVLSFDPKDIVFAERCKFYRIPGWENEKDRWKNIIELADETFVSKTFGANLKSKSVAKELIKIQFHDMYNHKWWSPMYNHKWWSAMDEFLSNKDHYHFDMYSLWNNESLTNEFSKISEKYNLNLNIDAKVINNVVEKIKDTHVVKTKDRANQIIGAIDSKINLECKDLDIIEQAYVEVELEKKHKSVLFPYGSNWFDDTDQINEFLSTYPTYLKHMNPRLRWYKNIRNPFYLSGQIDKLKQ
jgi:hypothetical protein